jgi:D-alanine-D-alanine ligase
MNGTKRTVIVLFGGPSPEHDVSIVTGLQVLAALDTERYIPVPVYVTGSGAWYTGDILRSREFYIPGEAALKEATPVSLSLGRSQRPALVSHPSGLFQKPKIVEFDAAIPAFHGLVGEDGRIQGMLEVAGIPYTGMRTLASAVLMDKAATKKILKEAQIPQLPYHEIRRPAQGLLISPDELAKDLGEVAFPCCVKPSHLGSSIGVARVDNFEELSAVLPDIFRLDTAAILEPWVSNLIEYNVSVSRFGEEIRTSAIECPKRSTELLDFKTKYLSGAKDASGTKQPGAPSSQGMLSLTRVINPALPAEMEQRIRSWAADAFRQVDGSGAPRIDFVGDEQTGEIWLNEVNPCPGSFGFFLWEAAAPPVLFSDLLDHLIDEALRLAAQNKLPADPTPAAARLFRRRA